jgi:hypothetical protein
MDQNELPLEPHQLGYHRVRSKWFLILWYVWSWPCTYLAPIIRLSPNRLIRDCTWRTSSISSIGCVQDDFWAMVRSAQSVHLSCSDTNTVSERTEMSFHLSLVTLEHHRVHLKWFSSLGDVRRKPCTYLVSRLAPSPNGPKQGSTRALSPRSTIGCIQNDFWVYGTFGANYAPILHWH